MAKAKKSNWSWSTGEKGINNVRVYQPTKGKLRMEWYEQQPGAATARRVSISLKHNDREKAKQQAEQFAVELRQMKPRSAAEITLKTLFDNYVLEVTPAKGKSQQGQDKRAVRVFTAFFNAQPESSRRMDRHPETLDRRDWDTFIEWRRGGKIPGWNPVRNKQIKHDLTFLVTVLNWATGQKRDGQPILARNPWDGAVRRAQGWTTPREINPHRPAMSDDVREKLIEHAASWQFGAALWLGRATGRRNSAIRQLLWSDVDFDNETITWRDEADKVGRYSVTPMTQEVIEILKNLPSRGIGDTPVFPSATDPTKPTPRDTFQIWLRRAKERLLRSVEDKEARERLRKALKGVGYHAEKRAKVRDPEFRQLPPKIQEEYIGTNYDTLRRIYDEVSVEDMRAALEGTRRTA